MKAEVPYVRRPPSHCPTTGDDGHLRRRRRFCYDRAACILSLNDVSSTTSDPHLGSAASMDAGNCVRVVWSTTNELAARGASDVRSGELFESDAETAVGIQAERFRRPPAQVLIISHGGALMLRRPGDLCMDMIESVMF